MKKYKLRYWILTPIIIGLCLLSEGVWIIYMYHYEKKEFTVNVNKSITTIRNELTFKNRSNTKYYKTLISPDQGYILELEYIKDNITVKIEGTCIPKYGFDLRDYDTRNDKWTLKRFYQYFQKTSDYPDLPITLILQNNSKEIFDYYPTQTLPSAYPTYPQTLLGYIDEHYLSAYYPFPFSYFWERQKYGLMISLIPLLLVLYYCFLLIIQRSRDHENDRFIEEQTIFIHDLKTPLCTNRDIESRILKNLNNWPIEKIHEKLEITYRQSYHLLCNIKELLLRSVMLWGSELRNQNFDLKKALEEIILYHQADHEKVRITLDFRLPNSIIYADPFHITHIIGNLINNAIKHGGEEVHIKITCSQGPQKQLIFSVQDNGPGIPSKIIKHIFRTGFRRSWSNQNNHGLGLAYVRKIVKQYSGSIHVKSQIDKGTEFKITIDPCKKTNGHFLTFGPGIYYKIFIFLLLTEAIWIYNLYSSEREDFNQQQTKFVRQAEEQVSKETLHWRDTAQFYNDTTNHYVIIIRGKQTAKIHLPGLYSDMDIYGRLMYDLRGDKWCLDSIYRNYRYISHNPLPVVLSRIDSNGNYLEYYPADVPKIHFPVVSEIPLGYIEKHNIKADFAFPWLLPLKNHRVWFIFTLASIILAGWLTYSLSVLAYRQEEISRFQREELQHFIRNLQSPIRGLLDTEEEVLHYRNTQQIHSQLTANTSIFNKILTDVNRLLDQLVTIKNHRPIFD